MDNSFYVTHGDALEPTGYVRGPWSFDHCHAGPPAALLVDRIAQAFPTMGLTRFTLDIPAPIPLAPVTVSIETLRAGRRITHVAARLVDLEGRTLATGAAWLMRVDESVLPPTARAYEVPAAPEDSPSVTMTFWEGELEIFRGIDLRAASGEPFAGHGQASMWLRPLVGLIDGSPLRPEALVGLVSDFQNGVSTVRPLHELLCVNTDVTFYLGRRPDGDWIGIDAATNSSGLGLGMTDSVLYDASGLVGTANQSIFFDSLTAGNPGTGTERLTDESS